MPMLVYGQVKRGAPPKGSCLSHNLFNKRLIVVMCDFPTNALYGASRRFFAAKPESEAESERKRDHQSLEERRHKSACDIELIQRRKNTEDPNCVFCNRAGKICRVRACGAGGAGNKILRHLRNYCGNNQDDDCNDNLREVEQNHRLKVVSDLPEAENLKRCHKEHYHYKPLHQGSQEAADIKINASAFRSVAKTGRLERVDPAQNLHYLPNNAEQNSADSPADSKNDNGHNYGRQVECYDTP